jgi:hypothetical protein
MQFTKACAASAGDVERRLRARGRGRKMSVVAAIGRLENFE